jgi:hypothetical protein
MRAITRGHVGADTSNASFLIPMGKWQKRTGGVRREEVTAGRSGYMWEYFRGRVNGQEPGRKGGFYGMVLRQSIELSEIEGGV